LYGRVSQLSVNTTTKKTAKSTVGNSMGGRRFQWVTGGDGGG
jgi:hypothetical protein